MFTLVRYVAVISFVLVFVGVSTIGHLARNKQMAELQQHTVEQFEAAFSSFTTTVWSRYAAELVKNQNSPYLQSFNAEAQQFFQRYKVLKITIFSMDVKNVYYPDMRFISTPSPSVSMDNNEPVRLPEDFSRAVRGETVSTVLSKIHITSSNAPKADHILTQIVLPLRRAGETAPDALVEVYVDQTDQIADFTDNILALVSALLTMSALLIIFIIYTTSRAEAIIGKQHEVNLELIAAAAQAEAQSRDKSQFLASISHELRTPLNAVIGFSDIIRKETKDRLEKVHQEYLDDINASGRHLLSLINDILDFSKAEAGKLQIEWAESDVTKIIRNSLRMVLPRAEGAQVTLVEDIPAQHLVVVTDAKKLKQVLLNLLSNAVKFTPAGGEVRCHAWVDVVTGAVNIQVRDTGIGIAPKDISRVMTPFGQVDSALSRKYEGTGLGLPLSKKFVESMGGTFLIESQIKVGTSVTITVPKAPADWGGNSMHTHTKAEQPNESQSRESV